MRCVRTHATESNLNVGEKIGRAGAGPITQGGGGRKGGQQSRAVHQPDLFAFLRLIQSQLGSRVSLGRQTGENKCERMMAGLQLKPT